MSDNPKYIYIMYPVPIEDVKNLSLPFMQAPMPAEQFTPSSEDFVPLWFGNARFPEDD